MERVKGIEPSSSVWKTVALPLSYTRILDVRADTRNREPAAADVNLLRRFRPAPGYRSRKRQTKMVDGAGFEPA
jgi:hypothetical protein